MQVIRNILFIKTRLAFLHLARANFSFNPFHSISREWQLFLDPPKESVQIKLSFFKWKQWDSNPQHLVRKRTLNHLAKLALDDWAVLWVLICTEHLTVCYCHVTYAFHSDSTLYSYLNVKELLARNRRHIWSLSESNEIGDFI